MRENVLMVKLTDAEKATIRRRADAVGMTMSSYVRWLVLNYTKFAEDVDHVRKNPERA